MTIAFEATSDVRSKPSANAPSEQSLDLNLQRAATSALGERRGTVIVMDPQTGRVRAVVNPTLAFEENLPPGSTIKPFTALAAFRSGLINDDSRNACLEEYSHDEFRTICSHPRGLPPLDPTEALAYSCNYYFGRLGERLNEAAFVSTLSEFGFGRKTGINAEAESSGKLIRNGWRSQHAIGESDNVLATPIQVINAYSALVNGGHLFTPSVAKSEHFAPKVQANLSINGDQRELIVKGMRGAVRYGTAETAGLYKLPGYIFGKTGTATQINGFRSQGWFVGFASDAGSEGDSQAEPGRVRLAVLVFLTKAHGSEAAEVARPVFDEFTRSSGEMPTRAEIGRPGEAETLSHHEGNSDFPSSNPPLSASPGPRVSIPYVRVHLVSENVTQALPLEDYVRSVVATEGSTENQLEALKALAIASRTYALKNMGRHERDGYDLCSTTHCQRYRPIDSQSGAYVSRAVTEAVEGTRGEILRDSGGNVVDSYFSASCGGATANMGTLWGGSAPPYLRGVRDEHCANQPHHSWTDLISHAHLLKALQSDRRTNVGGQLHNVTVVRRDQSDRAELIALEGDRRVTISGWEFKIVVGRALGWNLLKSSRFDIVRSGPNFVFQGKGFGHGLGLCQEGAHVMAARGASYNQILAKYFPTTRIATAGGPSGSADLIWEGERHQLRRSQMFIDPPSKQGLQLRRSAMFPPTSDSNRTFRSSGAGRTLLPIRSINIMSLRDCGCGPKLCSNEKLGTCLTEHTEEAHRPASASRLASYTPGIHRQTLRSEDFRISYPGNIKRQEIEALLSFLQSSRKSLLARVTSAGLNARLPSLEIFINETTGDFVGRTGQPAWAAAATKNNRIELQPLRTLQRRRILETTLRHELVHTLVDVLGGGRAPRWLAEGLAIHFAQEGPLVSRYQPRHKPTVHEIEQKLASPQSADDMRAAYAAAYSEVRRLIRTEGETNVWRRVVNS
ncbi:MAG TPA: SpoIID/LytB domain-containing protein [Pyrinomonadaceae bacterium]|nr:SpoIID/LytB domain-containing protein [Pyrinomonadaceae bacterium]